MKFRFLFLAAFLPFLSLCQTAIDPCDSIGINSIQLNATGEQVEVMVYNHSTDIMSYPGFLLFNANGDTMAIETVNYFGIGWNEQLHVLQIIQQPVPPFMGTLELHTHFYDSLRCTFPVTIDLSTSLQNNDKQELKIFPNPSCDWIRINGVNSEDHNAVRIFNMQGEVMDWEWKGNKILLAHFPSGTYFIRVNRSPSPEHIKLIVP